MIIIKKYIQKIYKEYQSQHVDNEDFLAYILHRKLTGLQKTVLFVLLWILFLRFAYDLRVMFRVFEIIAASVLIWGLYRLFRVMLSLVKK